MFEAEETWAGNKLMLQPTDYHEFNELRAKGITSFFVYPKDSRTKSVVQNKKIHAILSDIANYIGQSPEEMKALFKYKFMLETGRQIISCATIDMTTAREFIDYLLSFCVEYDVPLSFKPLEMCEDIQKYIYTCARFKKCAICGLSAELHHWDAIGMGNDREEVCHLGMKAISLCRKHHTEAHTIGVKDFAAKYHLEPIEIDKKIAKAYDLNTKIKGNIENE